MLDDPVWKSPAEVALTLHLTGSGSKVTSRYFHASAWLWLPWGHLLWVWQAWRLRTVTGNLTGTWGGTGRSCCTSGQGACPQKLVACLTSLSRLISPLPLLTWAPARYLYSILGYSSPFMPLHFHSFCWEWLLLSSSLTRIAGSPGACPEAVLVWSLSFFLF